VKDFYARMGLHPDPAKAEATAADSVVVQIEMQ
jgi:hypothetical protein